MLMVLNETTLAQHKLHYGANDIGNTNNINEVNEY